MSGIDPKAEVDDHALLVLTLNLFFPADWDKGLQSRLAYAKLKQRWMATFYPRAGTPGTDPAA
jgi:hypothetical protein